MSSASLRAEQNRVASVRDSYVRRKNQVDAIIRSTNNGVSPKPSLVNNAITDVEMNYEKAIKGKTSNLCFEIEDTIQKSLGSDSDMSRVLSRLSDESAHCQRKINDLNARIEQLNREIAAAEAAEAEAARRAAEAAAAAAAARAKAS